MSRTDNIYLYRLISIVEKSYTTINVSKVTAVLPTSPDHTLVAIAATDVLCSGLKIEHLPLMSFEEDRRAQTQLCFVLQRIRTAQSREMGRKTTRLCTSCDKIVPTPMILGTQTLSWCA